MRLIDAEAVILADLADESEVAGEKNLSGSGVTVAAARHPTLGRLVMVRLPDGSGVVVEIDDSGNFTQS